MVTVRPIALDSVISPVKVDLEDVLEEYRALLGGVVIRQPLLVHSRSRVLLSGFTLHDALDLLSVAEAPGVVLDDGDFELVGEDPWSALASGRTLPDGSFTLRLREEPAPIAYRLGDLRPGEVAPPQDRVFQSTLDLLQGNWPTPMVRLRSLSGPYREVYAKLEWYNPFSFSVKDRVAWAMVKDAIRRGCLGEALYEATSTNTGLALAALANVLGKDCKLYLPRTAQMTTDAYLNALGAEFARTESALTVDILGSVLEEAKDRGAVVLNQFENDENFKVHLKYTAKELHGQLESIGKRPNHIVGGLGTSGHTSAISFYFRARFGRGVNLVGVQPAAGSAIPGLRRTETGMKWLGYADLDEVIDVSLEEALDGVRHVARGDGILIGVSSGAVAYAIERLDLEGTVAAVFPDNGLKYSEYLGQRGRGRGTS